MQNWDLVQFGSFRGHVLTMFAAAVGKIDKHRLDTMQGLKRWWLCCEFVDCILRLANIPLEAELSTIEFLPHSIVSTCVSKWSGLRGLLSLPSPSCGVPAFYELRGL